MNYEISFLGSLALTICIESICLWIIVNRLFKFNKPVAILLFTGILTSFATLPYVWFVFPAFIPVKWLYILIAESFAIIVETIIIEFILKTGIKNSFILSLVCNIVSFGIGKLITIL